MEAYTVEAKMFEWLEIDVSASQISILADHETAFCGSQTTDLLLCLAQCSHIP